MADEQQTPETPAPQDQPVEQPQDHPTDATSGAQAVEPVGNAQVEQPAVTQDPAQLVSDFKKDELQTAAAVQGVDVPSSATKADIAQAIVEQTPSASAPAAVVVDNHTARSDADAQLGSWVDVVSGEYQGRFGSYVATVSSGSDGYPESVIIRTRDADNLLLEVNYSDLRPSDRNGGR